MCRSPSHPPSPFPPLSHPIYQRNHMVSPNSEQRLYHEPFDFILQSSDLSHQITSFVRRNARADYRSADAASTAESCFRRHVYVWNTECFGASISKRQFPHTSEHVLELWASAWYITYFLSSHNNGRWSRMASGAVSAARMMISEIPRFKVLVATKEHQQSSKKRMPRGISIKRTLIGALLQLTIIYR